MTKRIFLFVVLIRAFAAILITNAHYTGVYPNDLLANGGLLGDVLFFSVSGFCLASPSIRFDKWYLRRFIRIYTPTWIITIFYLAIGAYSINSIESVFTSFIWPTHWHFISSIILLYIPLYFVSKYSSFSPKTYWTLTGSLFIIQFTLYLTVYDKSYYHIDTVREPMIEFIFFQSMLIGLYYRERCKRKQEYKNGTIQLTIAFLLVLLILYFISKMLFVYYPILSPFQIINQIILWGVLYITFDVFMTLEKRLELFSEHKIKIWKCVSFISERTLEIYLVQYVIIAKLKIGIFPINWLILTFVIIVGATLLHYFSNIISQRILKLI